ncbi:hypothetical protein KO488_14695, partial [Poseidonibacter lekithochrous]|uniref:Calx-beta domain-containing protein n=1 Tax=Poseidonibacter TaxID=2321187 RepID=UPI001C09E1A2
GRILDNGDIPTLSVSGADAVEGDYAVFNIQLSNPSTEDIKFDLIPKAGTASTDDFESEVEIFVNGEWVEATSATIPAGETEIAARVKTTQDDIDEPTEQFTLEATVTDGTTTNVKSEGTASILDNDGIPQIVISDAVAQEEDGVLTFTVSLSNPSDGEVTVDFTTADGTALAGSDYEAAIGTITFAPGETSKTLSIPIIDDSIYEDSESMLVNLTNPVNAEIADEQGEGRILDNGDIPTLSVSGADAVEGDYAVFNIQLSNPSTEDIKFDLIPKAGTASTDDFESEVEIFVNGEWVEATSATIPAGETEIAARVKTTQDDIDEPTEQFTLEATVTDGTTTNVKSEGTASILDNDGIPQIVITDSSINEEDGVLTFTVSLSNPSDSAVTVDFTTADGTALAGSDYVSDNGTITFAPGETSKTISISVLDDNIFEADESMYINLTNPVNAEVADEQGEGRIADSGNESDIPTLSISDSVVTEGEFNIFTVQISNESTEDIKFKFSTIDGSAIKGDDYADIIEVYEVSSDNGITWTEADEATITAGNTAILVRVPTIEDDIAESNETYTLQAEVIEGTTTNNTYPEGTTASATGTIIDDD